MAISQPAIELLLTLGLAAVAEKVHAVDASERMVRLAREKVRRAGLGNVTVRKAAAEAMQATGAAGRFAQRFERTNAAHREARLAELRANAWLLRPALDLLNTSLLIAVLGLLFAVPYVVDFNSYRGTFEEEASRLLGREVRVGGQVNLRLLPTPFIRFEKIRVSDAQASVGEPLFKADDFTVWLAVAPLFNGTLQATEVELSKPVLTLVTNDKGGGDALGPNLFGIVGRKGASRPGYSYSAPMQKAGIVWNEASLTKWVAGPARMVPGTKMAFPGITSKKQQADVVAYLGTMK